MLVIMWVGVLIAINGCLRDLLHRLLDFKRQLPVRIAEAVEDLEEVSYGGDAEVRFVQEGMV